MWNALKHKNQILRLFITAVSLQHKWCVGFNKCIWYGCRYASFHTLLCSWCLRLWLQLMLVRIETCKRFFPFLHWICNLQKSARGCTVTNKRRRHQWSSKAKKGKQNVFNNKKLDASVVWPSSEALANVSHTMYAHIHTQVYNIHLLASDLRQVKERKKILLQG